MPDYIYLLENRLSADQRHALNQLREAAREVGTILFLTGDAVRDLTSGHAVRSLDLPGGTFDPEHGSQDSLALTQGSFRIVIGPLHAKFVNALGHASYNLKTCSGHAAATAAA